MKMPSLRASLRAAQSAGHAEIERSFWRNVAVNASVYGADTPGSLFPAQLTCWNLDRLPGLLNKETCGGDRVVNVVSVFCFLSAFFCLNPFL